LCHLDQAVGIGWRDLHVLGRGDPDTGWDQFAGIRVGIGLFFDEIVSVLSAPSCPPGAILALGVDLAGPGPAAMEQSLVLAPSFSDWMTHLESMGWEEFGLVAGEIDDLPTERQNELRQYYGNLNPRIRWG
jgi:hypothetical protein